MTLMITQHAAMFHIIDENQVALPIAADWDLNRSYNSHIYSSPKYRQESGVRHKIPVVWKQKQIL